jgi:GNAT superfamily N-acetyltransferase
MEGITVAVAKDHEARACLALLPEARDRSTDLLIARLGGAFAGAAALSWGNWTLPAGFPLTLHVVPDVRRRGVGRALLAAAADLAVPETDGLWTFQPLPESGEAAAFLRACGFSPRRRQHVFEGHVEALLANITPLLTRLMRRAGPAAEARIAPLAEASVDDVGWLVSGALEGAAPFAISAWMRHQIALGEGSLDRSQVALIEGKAAGVILWRLDKGVAAVDARVVAAPWRGGPINLRLLEAGLLRCRAEGIETLRFQCDDTIKDTISLARRAQAKEISTTANWYYPFDPRA